MATDKYNVEIVDSDGNSSRLVLPGFALDSTQEKLIKSVQALGKMNPKQAEAYEKLLAATNDAAKAGKSASEKQTEELEKVLNVSADKQVKALKSFRGEFADRVGKDMRDTFVSGGNILTAAIKTATVGLAAGAGLLYKTFMDTSDAFRSLAQSGLGGAGASGTEAQDAVAELTRLGMSAGEAAGLLTSFGQASAMLGKANFAKFISGIANAGSFAANLGLTLEEAAEFAAEEVSIRQRGLSEDFQLTAMNRQTVEESIRQTQRFSSVMGRSMKDINDSKKDFFQDNSNIDALMMRFTGARGERLNAELNLMIGAAAAIPGAYETLSKGLLNAAAAPVPVFDSFLQSVFDLGPLAGNLYNDTLEIAKQIERGELKGEEGTRRLNRSLLALDDATVRALQVEEQSGNTTAAMIISARTAAAKGAADQEKAFKKAAVANDAMVTAGVNFQNQLNRLSGAFTTVRNNVLGQFAEPLTKMLDEFALTDKALEDHNKQREAAIKADKTLSDEEKARRIASLRQKSVTDTLYDGLTKIADSFMRKFFPNINRAGDSVGQFIDMLVVNIDKFLTDISKFIDDLDGDTFGAKLADAAKKLFAQALPGIIYVLTETAKAAASALFSSPAVIDALALGIIGLFAASAAKSALAAGVTSLLRWVMTGSAVSAVAAPAATAATTAAGAATGGGLLAATTGAYAASKAGGGGFVTNAGQALKAIPGSGLAGRALTAAGGIGAAAMVGKDAYDVGKAYLTGGKMKGEDIGGVAGGVLGGIAGLVVGGPVGAALGASLGNYIGNKAGEYYDSYFNKDEAKKGSAEVAAATKEQLLQQEGLAAMAMDPEHIRAVSAALTEFNKTSVANISKGLATFNPALQAMFTTIQGIRVAFVDNVNNRFQKLLTIITGLNVEGLKLPITTQYLGELAEKITSMPIDKIDKLATTFNALTLALRDFASLTSSNFFTQAFDFFTGKTDNTTAIITVLNDFAKNVKADDLLKAAQATMAFNAGMAGYAAVPEQPARTSATGQQQSPADQVNKAANNMQYNNPYEKMRDIESELSRLNGFVRDSVIPALKGIQENTD
jgi:hypothetical protein